MKAPRSRASVRARGRPATPPLPAERLRAGTAVRRLAAAHPDWGPTLDFRSPLELLIATILAAQARDERVNEVTRPLFERYRTPADWLAVPDRDLERAIHPTGFFRQKARAIKGACRDLVDRFGGEVPRTVDELVTLHGVGRKTASIVAANAFGVPAVAVDRHVARVAGRLGLSAATDGDRIEADLRALLPRAQWVKATWCLVLHGRRVCRPTPDCPRCPVLDLCPYGQRAVAGTARRVRPSRPRAASATPPARRATPRRAAPRPSGG